MKRARPLWLVLIVGAGCWSSAHPADPPRWSTAPAPELLPDGAWIEAGIDFDVATNSVGRSADPSQCQIPSLHAAFAGYDHEQFGLAVRGDVEREAMYACLARRAVSGKAERSTFAGRDVLVTSDGSDRAIWFVGHRILLGGSADVMERALAAELRPSTADPRLGPLIAHARAGGDMWLAARLPRRSKTASDLLALLELPPEHIESVVASVRFGTPTRLLLVVETGDAASANGLVVRLEARRLALLDRVGPGLRPILAAIAIITDGPRVAIRGEIAAVDWMRVLQDVMTLIGDLREDAKRRT